MKKLMIAAAIVCAATFANAAAAIGWSASVGNTQAGNAYDFFIIGQKGVDSILTITALLDEGKDVSSYAFGSGNVAANGAASVPATTAGQPTLEAGTYTSFMVLFNTASQMGSDDPKIPAADKYVVLSGASTQTKEINTTAKSMTFAAGNMQGVVGNPDNWKSIPEPTSGLLLLLGVAGLALRRRRA